MAKTLRANCKIVNLAVNVITAEAKIDGMSGRLITGGLPSRTFLKVLVSDWFFLQR
jgi:hypothetical protein